MAYKDTEVARRKAKERFEKNKKDPVWYEEHKRRSRKSAKKKRLESKEYRETNKINSTKWRHDNPERAKVNCKAWYLKKSQDSEWVTAYNDKVRSRYHNLNENDKRALIQSQTEYVRKRRIEDPEWHKDQKHKAREIARERYKDTEYRRYKQEIGRRSNNKRRQDPEVRQKHCEDSRKRQRETLLWMYDIKKRTGCSVCKEIDPRCLDFHHRDPDDKKFTISNRLSFSRKRLLKEIAKCDIMCSNCHRKLTRVSNG